jgi:enoyl-CoA hydratase/carnithine racemase
MRADRGSFCFSEVNVPVAFTESLIDVIKLIPNQHALNEMVLTGVAWNGEQCLARNVVDAIYPQDELLEQGVAWTKALANKDRKVYGEIKRNLRRDLVRWV